MNKSFRSVWNASKQAYVAAAETVSAKGKPSSGVKVAFVVFSLMGSLLGKAAYGQNAPPTSALPTGGQVSSGLANISQAGANMVIQQSSNRAAINWQSFNVGKDAQVQFQQPNSGSVTLNRVLSNDPSQILGRITANGQVILTNPSGIYFSPSAKVDVGGLIATTHSISDADFKAGNYSFVRNGSTASIINEGELKAGSLGGYIALLAPEVRNQGAVIAQMGTVAMASGEAIDLKFDVNDRLTSLRVTPSQIQSLVDNRYAVQAPGGLIILSAQSLDRLVGGVVNNSGVVEASSLQEQGGRIVLSASHKVDNSGGLLATGLKGGSISLQSDQIDLTSSARIHASGAREGGTVLAGGNWQGSEDPLLQATGQPSQSASSVMMANGATIDVSAMEKGDGGKVVLWSDVHKEGGKTAFAGQITARGGSNGGQGGRVETSGNTLAVLDTAKVDTTAAKGATGEWLLDPINFSIVAGNGAQTSSGIGADTLVSNLNASNVTIATDGSTAGVGYVWIRADVISNSSNNLTLKAHQDIIQAEGITVSTQGGNITYWADSDNNQTGAIVFSGTTGTATVNSHGGNITFAGGLDSGSGTPAGYAFQIRTTSSGTGAATVAGALSLDTGGGNLVLKSKTNDTYFAMNFPGDVNFNSGSGSITIDAQQTGAPPGNVGRGITFNGVTTITSAKNNGTAISISGVSAGTYGMVFETPSSITTTSRLMQIVSTGSGGIDITSSGLNATTPLFLDNVRILAASGDININAGNSGMTIKTNASATTVIGQQSGLLSSSSSNVNITTGRLTASANSSLTFETSGHVYVEPSSTSFSAALDTSQVTFGSSISGLKLGKSGSTSNLTIGRATNVAGPIDLYGGNVTLNSTATATNSRMSIYASGAVTDGSSGGVVANELLLTGGNVTLDSNNNDVGTIAASGVGSLTYVDSNALTIGQVGATQGVNATGGVSISTATDNLTVAQNIVTTNATSSALVLNAGKAAAVGTATGGDIIITGSPTLTVGSGGRVSLYTGSLSGSTGLTGLSGLIAGTERYRYNADETTDFSSGNWTNLGSGTYGIYRESPTITLTSNGLAMTYGDALPALAVTAGLVNGDTTSTYSVANRLNSSTSNIQANSTPYAITADIVGLGYNVPSTTLMVNPKALTVSGLSSSDKVYDGTTTAVVNGTAALQSTIAVGSGSANDGKAYTGDAVSLTGTPVGNFNTKDVATANTVAFTGLSLAGADAGNYTITANDSTPRITAKALAVSGLSSSDKVYDGTTTAVVNGTAALQSTIAVGSGSANDGKAYTGDAVSLTGTPVGNFNTKDVATANTVAFTGLSLTGADAGNYTITQPPNDSTPRITSSTLTGGGTSSSFSTQDVGAKHQATVLPLASPGTTLSNDAIPQPFPVVQVSQAVTGSNSSASLSVLKTSDLKVQSHQTHLSTGLDGMLMMSLPKGTAGAGVGLSIELPESVRPVGSESANARAYIANDQQLPEWLKFDAKTLRFEAKSVPASGLPPLVIVNIGGKRSLIVFSEMFD